MAVLRCKMCGGQIVLSGAGFGICDSCGCEVTVPKKADDMRANMYDRGNQLRKDGNFDEAYTAFEHIIADDPTDAEAHWCLTLCRYGIEYVEDPRTGEYKPTVSRMSGESVLEDADYQAALRYSDERTKEIYRREAKRIADIQKRYLEIARKEKPYDVFICFRAEEADHSRTESSVIGQEIYDLLTAKGVKVFFSRITLQDKLAEAYEPYIYAALHSAKVMLVVATKPAELRQRWVKNEWSRYLALMEKDRSKSMIPVYKDMDEEDFPSRIPLYLAKDIGAKGALQDLVRDLLKMTGQLSETKEGGEAVSLKNLLARARMAVEDKEFKEAAAYVNRALDLDPENGQAYYYALLADFSASNGHELIASGEDYKKNRNYKRASMSGDADTKALLQALAEEEPLWEIYCEAEACAVAKEYIQAAGLYDRVAHFYPDASEKAGACRRQAEYDKAKEAYESEWAEVKNLVTAQMERYEQILNTGKEENGSLFLDTKYYAPRMDAVGSIAALIFSVLMLSGERGGGDSLVNMAVFVWSVSVMGMLFHARMESLSEHLILFPVSVFLSIAVIGAILMSAPLPAAILMTVISLFFAVRIFGGKYVKASSGSAEKRAARYYNQEVVPKMEQAYQEINKKYQNQLKEADLKKASVARK